MTGLIAMLSAFSFSHGRIPVSLSRKRDYLDVQLAVPGRQAGRLAGRLRWRVVGNSPSSEPRRTALPKALNAVS